MKLRRFADGRRRMEFSVLIGGEEGADSVDNGPELFFAQFGEHRQRQDFTADPMGHRQILRRVAEILEAFLLVEAERKFKYFCYQYLKDEDEGGEDNA